MRDAEGADQTVTKCNVFKMLVADGKKYPRLTKSQLLKVAIKQINEIINANDVWARLSKSLKAESEVSEKIGQLKLQVEV